MADPPLLACHQDRHVIAASLVVPVKDAGDQARVPLAYAGIAIEVPVRGQAVGMHEQQRVFGPGIIVCLDFANRVPDGAVLRDHARGFAGCPCRR